MPITSMCDSLRVHEALVVLEEMEMAYVRLRKQSLGKI